MTRRVRLSKKATRDLEDIFEYTLDRWGEDQAIRYVDGLRKHLQNLAEREKLGLSRPWRPGSEIYRSRYEEHVIFYLRTATTSDIGMIPHGQQDFSRDVAAFQARSGKTATVRVSSKKSRQRTPGGNRGERP